MGQSFARTIILITLATLLAGCGPAAPTVTPAPPVATQTRVPPTLQAEAQEDASGEFKGKVDVGGYEMYLHCVGAGTPTVILEAGYDDVAETWSLVQPEIARFTRVCSYDRAGLGQSDPGPEPRNSLQMVKELRALLENAAVKGPYVLVGHSLGGMYVRLFADCYQEDVVGLVLVDSSHIDQFWRNAMVLPPESPDESDSLKFYREWFTNPPTYPTLPRRLFEAGSLGDMPLVVLTSPAKERADDLPPGLSAKFDEIWVELQKEWARISSQSTHVIAHESGHFIQRDQPDLVIDAILQVIEDARRAIQAEHLSPTQTTTSIPLTETPTMVIRDVPYITDGHPKQKLDIYLPKSGDRPFPTLLLIHGGGVDKRDLAHWAHHFIEQDYAAISINYRDVALFDYLAPVQDAFCALAWTHANADTYGFDPRRIIALGHSAGGNLTAMLGTVDDPGLFIVDCPYQLPEADRIQGAIPFTGIFDYVSAVQFSPERRPHIERYLGAELDQSPETWAEASASTWVDGSEPPFLLIHGTEDHTIESDQSVAFAETLEQAGVDVQLLLIPGADHGAILNSEQSFEAVEGFLATLAKAPAPTVIPSPPLPGKAGAGGLPELRVAEIEPLMSAYEQADTFSGVMLVAEGGRSCTRGQWVMPIATGRSRTPSIRDSVSHRSPDNSRRFSCCNWSRRTS